MLYTLFSPAFLLNNDRILCVFVFLHVFRPLRISKISFVNAIVNNIDHSDEYKG